MEPRRLGLLVVLAALGVAAGFGLATLLGDDDPAGIDAAGPVAAASPSVPADPAVEVLDDPETRALAPNQDTHLEKIGIKPFFVRVPVPDGWLRNNSAAGEWKWTEPGQPDYFTFFLRVRLVDNRFQTMAALLEERISALSGAESVSDFELESRSGDTFVASYVDNGYRRVATESFISTDGDVHAELWIAAVGRERDRPGLSDLLNRVRLGTVPGG